MQKFRLLIGLLDVEASSLLDKWIGLAVKNEVKELDLIVQTYKNAMYTLPWIIFSAASLKALKLEGCKLEHIPEIVQMKRFDYHFWGLKHISVVKPQKLKICSICGPINELKRVELAAPSLQQFAITSGIRGSIIIDVADCSNLKVLKLKGINLIDQEFHRLMSKVPMLEDLKEIEIDTSNLLSFHYRNHPVLTSIVNAPCPWELQFKNAIDELGNRVDPDAQWFLNMKDFLGISNQIRSIVIDVRSTRDSFNFEEFRNNLSSLPTEVEKLGVCLDAPPSSFAALLNGLLGICYSRKFYVYIRQELHHNFYEWLCNEMVKIDDNCCNSRNIKCWRHYLKDFKIKGLHFYRPSLNRKPLGVKAVMHLSANTDADALARQGLVLDLLPDDYSFPCVIKACGALNNVRLGRLVHDTIRLLGFEFDVFVGSSLVKIYAGSHCIGNARCLFEKLPHRDCVSWSVMRNGYVICGESEYSERKHNSLTFSGMLFVCAMETTIDLGTQLHGSVVHFGLEFDSPVANTLLALNVKMAYKIFNQSITIDLVMCTAVISGYVLNVMNNDALEMYRWLLHEKISPNAVTLSPASVLPASLDALKLCKEADNTLCCASLLSKLDNKN
ncbi:hypothetical protein EZV62_003922 [Acer yangbiense]|uniref:FBD domain-containing protein n=1 Tax=Acer yangbiense TaxID=1000413 RepID=A0A5C7II31_9ROSI|nr:hypothetical protein EZV62_003922 [Acer yangbiense]